MRLSDFNPRLTPSQLWPGVEELSFDCPKCGPPYRVAIHVTHGVPDAHNHLWHYDGANTEELTLVPTVTNSRHGRKPCGWSGNIVRGHVRTQTVKNAHPPAR